MSLPLQERAPDETWQQRPTVVRDAGRIERLARSEPGSVAVLALLLGASWAAGWALGGTGRVAPHWFYVPIIFAASRFGVLGSLPTSAMAGILAGPLLPSDVVAGLPQALSDWLSRSIFFVLIGSVMAVIVGRHKKAERLSEEHEAELETLRALDLSVLGVAPFEETLSIARAALDKLVWADHFELILMDGPPGSIRRYWVNEDGESHRREEPEPRTGPVAEVLREGEPLVRLVDHDGSEWENELASEGLCSFLLVPFDAEGEVLGAMAISSRREDPFPASEIATAIRIATQLAVALRASGMRSEIGRRVAELDAIRKVSEAAGSSLDLREVLDQALEPALEVTGLDAAWVCMLDEASAELVIEASRNVPASLGEAAARCPLHTSVLGRVVADGRPKFLRDVSIAPGLSATEPPAAGPSASIIAVPLWLEHKVIGLFVLATLDSRVPSPDDLRLVVALARPIAAAVGNARLHDRTRRLEAQRQQLLTKLVRAQEEERKRVAVDLHDDAVQVMAAVALRIDLLRETLTDLEQVEAADKCAHSARESVTRLRHMLFELHPPSLDREGLAATVRLSLGELEEETGINAVLKTDLVDEPPAETRVLLYRMIREALTNVRKHSRASRVDMHMEERDKGFFVQVRDDGDGFDPTSLPTVSPGHLGLDAMRERAEFAGGLCRVRSEPGRGTTVEAWLPDPRALGETESEQLSQVADSLA